MIFNYKIVTILYLSRRLYDERINTTTICYLYSPIVSLDRIYSTRKKFKYVSFTHVKFLSTREKHTKQKAYLSFFFLFFFVFVNDGDTSSVIITKHLLTSLLLNAPFPRAKTSSHLVRFLLGHVCLQEPAHEPASGCVWLRGLDFLLNGDTAV